MKAVFSLFALVALVALHHADATISCYVCTTASSSSDCWPPVKYDASSSNSSSIIDDVVVVNDCTSCLTNKATAGSVTTYTRTCLLSSTTTKSGCATANSVTSCNYVCDTNLCNSGSYASIVRYSVLSIASAFLLSVTAKFVN